MSGNKNKLIAFNYFGGKFTWTDYLYQHFPTSFTHLVDVFAGSLCVSLNYTNNGITYRTALRRMGVELPDEVQRLF